MIMIFIKERRRKKRTRNIRLKSDQKKKPEKPVT
jgi:hypothetical protein